MYKPKFNKQKGTRIGWADYSWNPLHGCLFRCEWCYALDDRERRHNDPDFLPAFEEKRLCSLEHPPPKGRGKDPDFLPPDEHRVCLQRGGIVGAMGAGGVDTAYPRCNHHLPTMVLLHPNQGPRRHSDFIDSFPPNLWLGCTGHTQAAVNEALDVFHALRNAGVTNTMFLSVEPFLGPHLRFELLGLDHHRGSIKNEKGSGFPTPAPVGSLPHG